MGRPSLFCASRRQERSAEELTQKQPPPFASLSKTLMSRVLPPDVSRPDRETSLMRKIQLGVLVLTFGGISSLAFAAQQSPLNPPGTPQSISAQPAPTSLQTAPLE